MHSFRKSLSGTCITLLCNYYRFWHKRSSLPQHLGSLPVFNGVRFARYLGFLCSILQTNVCHFVVSLLVIALSVLLPFSAFDCSFGILKRFGEKHLNTQEYYIIERIKSVQQYHILTLPQHLNSLPVFNGIRVARSLVFCVAFYRLLFVILSVFPLVIALSVLIFSAFNCSFGILKRFVEKHLNTQKHYII